MKKYIQPQSYIVEISTCHFFATSNISPGKTGTIGVSTTETSHPLSDDVEFGTDEKWYE